MKYAQRPVILIGGVPTAGKSTLAKLLSKHLGIPWISTDQIGDIMTSVASKRKMPKLFSPEGKTPAEKYFKKFTSEQIVQFKFEQSEPVWEVVKKMINNDTNWSDGFIIEGVSLLPHLIATDSEIDKNVKIIFLVDENVESIREVLFTRGLWDHPGEKYSDEAKEKELDWVLLFSQKIKADAVKYNLPWVQVEKNDYTLEKVKNILKI
jgi:2-phosphoglycerate kinase